MKTTKKTNDKSAVKKPSPAKKAVCKQPEKCAAKAKPAAKKPVKTAKPAVASKEANLKKLAKTDILNNFIKKNKGCWNHQMWMDLCKNIEKQGLTPIDFDQVGLMLEDKKQAFLAK